MSSRWHDEDFVADWVRERDHEASPAYLRRKRAELDRIIAAIPFAPRDRFELLDLGAGWGRTVGRLLERFPEVRATAIDASEPMLERARAALAPFGDRASVAQVDLARDGALDALRGRFDVVVSQWALHHLPPARLGSLYAEVYAALRPGGVAMIVTRVRASRWRVVRLAYRVSSLARVPRWAGEAVLLADQWTGPAPSAAPASEPSLAEHLALLRDAGFATQWKKLPRLPVLFYARR